MGPFVRWWCAGTLIGALCWPCPAECRGQEDGPIRPDHRSPQAAGEDATAARFQRALEQKVDVDFQGTPLVDVARFVEQHCRIPVVIDRRSLDDTAIAAEEPVVFSARNIKLGTALRWILRPLDLTWVVDDDVVFITTDDTAGTTIEVRVYDVQDLLEWDRQLRREAGFKDLGGYDYDTLVEIIISQVAPTSWPVGTDPAPIRMFAGTLVIPQSQQVHQQIEDLLTDLRQVREARQKSATPARTLNAARQGRTP